MSDPDKKRVAQRERVAAPSPEAEQSSRQIDFSISIEYINREGQRVTVSTKRDDFIPLTNGRKIASKYFHLYFGDIFEKGQLNMLDMAGMPMSLPRWVMIIEGEGVGKPDFEFRFVGVRIHNLATCPSAETTHPHILEIWNDEANASMGNLLFGFIWERRVLLNGCKGILTEVYDPHHRLERNSKTGWALAQLDLASNKATAKERANLMRKLAEGYELMTAIWESMYKPRGGPNRKRTYLKTDAELKAFVHKVDELRPIWETIKRYFIKQDYDGGCVKGVQEYAWFQELSTQCNGIPESVLKLVMARQDETGRKNWPYAFALEHARIIFKIKVLGFDRLDEVYKEGKRLN